MGGLAFLLASFVFALVLLLIVEWAQQSMGDDDEDDLP